MVFWWLALGLGCQRGEGDDIPAGEPIAAYDPLSYVDPFIATGGPGAKIASVNPGAAWPFGLVQAAPLSRSNIEAPWQHCAGYFYEDPYLVGFGHTIVHGMGVTDMGGVAVMPKRGWEDRFTRLRERKSAFSHDQEAASAGYYEVDLLDDDVNVALTVTPHGALHRYTFAENTPAPVVLIDLGYTNSTQDRVGASWVEVDATTGRVWGEQLLIGNYSGRFGGARHHFEGVIEPAPLSVGAWSHPDVPEAGAVRGASEEGGSGAWMVFPAGTTEVRLRIALSFVDVAGAANNLAAEIPSFDFEAARGAAEAAWREELGGVRVRGGTERERRIFHTAMYHAYQMPRVYSDVDGRYRGVDQAIHNNPGFRFHNDFSGWDTYRTLHPWYLLARPERQVEMVRSLVQMADDGGVLPRWPLAHGYTGGMIGTPMHQILAETWLKGWGDAWDAERAFDYAWMGTTTTQPRVSRAGVDHYLEHGFVAREHTSGAAAHTLEYAWSDHALARWADGLGRSEAADAWRYSQAWKNTFDAESGFFWARSVDGSFPEKDDPTTWSSSFVEGAAWQYVWMVPQDVEGLIDVQHGGDRDAFLTRYDSFWNSAYSQPQNFLPGLFYWHGNEPDIHYSWIGSFANAPEHSARPARWVMETLYDDGPTGLDGNDDGGTLSAWYLLTAIGLYPIAGTPDYGVGTPLFERVEIDLPSGETLVLDAPGASAATPYASAVWLGTEKLDRSMITHQELVAAGGLPFAVSETRATWTGASEE